MKNDFIVYPYGLPQQAKDKSVALLEQPVLKFMLPPVLLVGMRRDSKEAVSY